MRPQLVKGATSSAMPLSNDGLTSDQKLSHPLLTVLGVAGIPVIVLQSLSSSLPESVSTSLSSTLRPSGELLFCHNRIEATGEAGSDLKNGNEGVLAGGAGKAASVISNDVLALTPKSRPFLRGRASSADNVCLVRLGRGLGGVGGCGVARDCRGRVGEFRNGN
jgi:hypothetical protein